ncbi:ead/Ea22-like family protein [Klebsiella grimontii]|uniref:ead/Ea22-like family protein n=1 Tax=Klebsiella grimontii TaxID=2058152 RepID=UPI0012B99B39|nr:ead/Ea22-like family protein [Klebsiella grimontii]
MTTNITELAQRMKAAAEKATPGHWEYYPGNTSIEYNVDSMDEDQGSIVYVDSGDFTQAQTDRNGEFIALANPANIRALVEALEKAQRANAAQDDHINQQQDRIESLEKKNAELGKYAGELETIRAAAEKLVRCKGRYHSELNYRALAALFGVTTPDLPPLDGESRTVTVKLPKPISVLHRRDFTDAHRAIYAYPEAEVNAALDGVGIKWEAE